MISTKEIQSIWEATCILHKRERSGKFNRAHYFGSTLFKSFTSIGWGGACVWYDTPIIEQISLLYARGELK